MKFSVSQVSGFLSIDFLKNLYDRLGKKGSELSHNVVRKENNSWGKNSPTDLRDVIPL